MTPFLSSDIGGVNAPPAVYCTKSDIELLPPYKTLYVWAQSGKVVMGSIFKRIDASPGLAT